MLSDLFDVLEEVNEEVIIDEELEKKLAKPMEDLVRTLKSRINLSYTGLFDEANELPTTEQIISASTVNRLVIVLQMSSDNELKPNIMTALKIIAADKTGLLNTALGKTEIFRLLVSYLEQVKTLQPNFRKLALDLLNLLLKNNLNSSRAARQGLAPSLLNLLSKRKQLKSKARFKFCKVLISCLYQIAKHKCGRQQLNNVEGLRQLYGVGKEFPDDERYDQLLDKLGTVIIKCNNPQNLSFLLTFDSPLKFETPKIKSATLEAESSDSSEDESLCEENPCCKKPTNDDLPYQLKWRPLDEIRANYAPFFENQRSSIEAVLENLPNDDEKAYEKLWKTTKGIQPFESAAYPDLIQAGGVNEAEPLKPKQRHNCRAKLLQTLDHSLHPETYKPQLVYDLDELMRKSAKTSDKENHLHFESRFESGNLRKALKIGEYTYDLILTPDVNSRNRQSWFYFRVSRMKKNQLYTFRIVNLEKQRSLFNEGMQPLLFSTKQSLASGRGEWQRCGQDICYFRNVFRNPASARGKNFMTLAFSVAFPHEEDECYLAFHYPYTYTRLLMDVRRWMLTDGSSVRVKTLCHSPNGNPVPVIFFGEIAEQQPHLSKVVVFMARVHPSESNSSWVMQGFVDAVLGRRNFKESAFWNNKLIIIVPMLNVDGVINGCGRCDVSNEDLNRRWNEPDSFLHPALYHTKGLLEYLVRVVGCRPSVVCDLHGHSRKLNVFLYGCSRHSSWRRCDHHEPDDSSVTKFAGLIARELPAFDSLQCSWQVERYRETTARVFFWRNLNIPSSFTIESSLAGGKTSAKLDCHYNPDDYRHVGSAIYSALLGLWSQDEELASKV